MGSRRGCARGTTDAEPPAAMSFDNALGGLLSIALAAYLVFALLRPERF